MIYISLGINCLLFFLLFNAGYLKKRRTNPDCAEKPFSQLVVFPLALGIVFTILIDVMKGMMLVQLLIFLIFAALLYLFFYVFSANK